MTQSVAINGARGEVEIVIDGAPYRLCLTLGALAEIESALGCLSLQDLEGRMQQVSAGDIVRLVQALLRGGGDASAAAGLVENALDVVGAARSVAAAFRAAVD